MKKAIAAIVLLILILLSRATTMYSRAYYAMAESDPARGAATVSADLFGDRFTDVKYLEQGWSPADSLWFYTTTQGSDLLPYDFFLNVEQATSQELFRSSENQNRYRYLPQKATRTNPDALPLGMVADTYRGKKYFGYTCAACHTSQVNYNGVGLRIDGGPAAADMDEWVNALAASLAATSADAAKRQRFVAAVLKNGNYANEADVVNDLKVYTLRLQAYAFFNDSHVTDKVGHETQVPYGYARLDAFGRIYNRVLEHVVSPEALREVFTGALPPAESQQLLENLKPVLTGENRDHLMDRLATLLTPEQRRVMRDRLFNSPNAPVSYPFIWDIPQHDYVQWNGVAANADVGAIGRNTGEVIGVFATLDWEKKKGWTISSVLGGQGFGDSHVNFQSSVNAHNLRQLEDRLWSLQSPRWVDAVKQAGLPPIDEKRSARGEKLFDQHCAQCHAEIVRDSPSRRIVAHMDRVSVVGTDPTMASNAADYMGYSGIMRNWYAKTGVGDVLLSTRAPAPAITMTAGENVVITASPDKWFFTRWAESAVDLIKEYRANPIKPSLKSGSYTPDTTAAPFESLRAYKGRSLNGIWATAPYLHNGSVPTLYDLLLPADPKDGDPAGTVYRPKRFMVGSRELDVRKVGFKHGETEYAGFLFDSSKPTNSNAGHEYGTRQMSDEDRWDLVEYLKSL